MDLSPFQGRHLRADEPEIDLANEYAAPDGA